MSAIEPPGVNCTNGGVKYPSATGTNSLCNGATGPTGAQGPPGPQGDAGPPAPAPSCPSGTSTVLGWCVEGAQRPAAPWNSALATCTGAGRSLLPSDLLVTVSPSGNEWSGTVYYVNGFGTVAATFCNTTGCGAGIGNDFLTNSHAYRCCFRP